MSDDREWLVTDGLGGYAMGRADGLRTRRYHSFLLVAMQTDERRFVLVNALDVSLEMDGVVVPLSSHRYAPDVVAPDGAGRLTAFTSEPWPTWSYAATPDVEIVQDLFTTRGRAATILRWRLIGPADRSAKLHVRLLLSGRDWHALHHENPAFRFDVERGGDQIWRWCPYHDVPPVVAHANATYRHDPVWYRNFLYTEERARGLDHVEDLASPGVLTWDLASGHEAELLLSTSEDQLGYHEPGDIVATCRTLRNAEKARIAAFRHRLHHSADDYVVQRGQRQTIIAGYPWFTDWGRDTFIALRGLCLATGRLDQAERILASWSEVQCGGLMPNYFPSHARSPAYNSADAALWFVIATQDFLRESARRGHWVDGALQHRLTDACEEILHAYARGAPFGIRMDDDALLRAGEPGSTPPAALTWMDAVVDGRPVTPRVGKPVELQALWANALAFGSRWSEHWGDVADRVRQSFHARFWNAERECLFDVVDVDHRAGAVDGSVRPNQVLACGGLPIALVEGERLRRVVDVLERKLWTPLGLRSLAPDESGYRGRCEGAPAERDRAYHQGTVWPWLVYSFVDAWVRASGGTKEAWAAARRRFLPEIARHLDVAGSGHVSEIADGDAPYTPRGCPFQAWSVGETIRAFGLGA